MKRFILLLLTLSRKKFKFYFLSAVIGGFLGLFVFYPIYEFIFIFFHEELVLKSTGINFVLDKMMATLSWVTPSKTLFLIATGMFFGIVNARIYEAMHRKFQQIEQLSNELGKDLLANIAQGEGPTLEFKSSFRWDIKQARVNRALENVVLKTLAGFMNSRSGGTLLIGVADNGEVLGLDNDFQSLKKKDNDGFEQAIMTSVSEHIGADLCENIHVLFHVVEAKEVCRLIVSPASRAVYLNQSGVQKFYLRTGGGTRELSIQEAMDYINKH